MKLLPALVLALPLVACEAAPAAPADEPGPAGADYAFVFLTTGPVEPDPATLQETMAGHFANMRRLAAERRLLVAGPLGPPRSRPDHRGVFVFDLADPADAEALAASDPAIAAGILAAEALPFRSPSPLRSLPAREEAALAARHAAALASGELEPAGDPAEGPGGHFRGRAYVLATAPGLSGSAFEALARDPRVLFLGHLGGRLAGTTLAALDATTPDEAAALVATVPGAGGAAWTWLPWYSSDVLLELAGTSAGQDPSRR